MDKGFFSFIRQSHIATNLWQWGKVAVIWTLAIALVMATLTFRSLKHAADVSSRYYETQALPGLNEKIEGIYIKVDAALDNVNSILGRADSAVSRVDLLAGDLQKRHVPVLVNETASSIHKIGNIVDTANQELKDTGLLARTEVKRTSDNTNGLLETIKPKLVDTVNQVATTIVQFGNDMQAAGKRVRVLVDDPQLETDIRQAVSGIAGSSANLDIVTGNIAAITGDAHDYFHKLVKPDVKGFTAKFKYVVQILGQVGGLVLLGVKIAAGL